LHQTIALPLKQHNNFIFILITHQFCLQFTIAIIQKTK
jgi:hypothetical protein